MVEQKGVIELICKYCKKVIIKDLNKFLAKDKEKYIECPYCFGLIWKRDLEDLE